MRLNDTRYGYDVPGWISRDPIGENGGFSLYDYSFNDPISITDPMGLFGFEAGQANSSYNFWMNAAASGAYRGGILGNAQAAGASTMAAVIDFFGARNVENHSTIVGTAAGNGDTGTAIAYTAATAGDILLA